MSEILGLLLFSGVLYAVLSSSVCLLSASMIVRNKIYKIHKDQETHKMSKLPSSEPWER